MLDKGEIRNFLTSLHNLDATDGLPEWESNFVSDLMGKLESWSWNTNNLSSKQIDKIEELYNRRILKADHRRFHERR